jgi:DNA-binding response OmpR family regulator
VANILVVDDDDTMRSLVKTVLERRGHDVSEARDGAEGLAKFDELLPDLLVTDVVMPRMGGIELIAELQRRRPEPRLLMLSGRHIELDGELCALAGRGLLKSIAKPFAPAELAEAVRALLG